MMDGLGMKLDVAAVEAALRFKDVLPCWKDFRDVHLGETLLFFRQKLLLIEPQGLPPPFAAPLPRCIGQKDQGLYGQCVESHSMQ